LDFFKLLINFLFYGKLETKYAGTDPPTLETPISRAKLEKKKQQHQISLQIGHISLHVLQAKNISMGYW
jgi:hypothetical protein